MKSIPMWSCAAAVLAASLVAQTSTPTSANPKAAASAVEVSADMKSFLALFDGTDKAVTAAVKKYGGTKLDDKDMHLYNLKDPKVTASATKADQTCYTFKANSGLTTRAYVVCWQGGKIVSVEDKGFQ
jgi:hypothetical protein